MASIILLICQCDKKNYFLLNSLASLAFASFRSIGFALSMLLKVLRYSLDITQPAQTAKWFARRNLSIKIDLSHEIQTMAATITAAEAAAAAEATAKEK